MKLNKVLCVLLIFVSSFLKADELTIKFDSANTAYSKGRYDKAIELYEQILSSGMESSVVYYNLANGYLKTDHLGKAILNYERAKKLDPDDEDINANLKLANQRTEDKIEAAPQLFLAQWENGVTDIMTEKDWSLLLIISIISGVALMVMYVVASGKSLKQIGFFGGTICILLSIFLFFMARSKYNSTVNNSSAIITAASVTVTGSPVEQGTKLFILHEGTKVHITEKNEEWVEIKIANGNVGWIKNSSLEEI